MPSKQMVSFKATAAKEMVTKANAIKVKRSYEAKMLRKYEHLTQKRIRDKRLLLDRKLKEWTLEL
jgi:hypothetical protein